jgi:hypothetical protein
MQPPMHVGIFMGIGPRDRINHDLRFLRRCAIIKVNQWLAIDLPRQDWEIGADFCDI